MIISCCTQLFRLWLGVTEYLFRKPALLDEVIKTAIEDNTFRSDDLEFTFAARVSRLLGFSCLAVLPANRELHFPEVCLLNHTSCRPSGQRDCACGKISVQKFIISSLTSCLKPLPPCLSPLSAFGFYLSSIVADLYYLSLLCLCLLSRFSTQRCPQVHANTNRLF